MVSTFNTFPVPQVDDMLEKIGQAYVISTLDLTKGYWQIPTDKERTLWGLFQFMHMLFGLHGSAASFQKLINHI